LAHTDDGNARDLALGPLQSPPRPSTASPAIGPDMPLTTPRPSHDDTQELSEMVQEARKAADEAREAAQAAQEASAAASEAAAQAQSEQVIPGRESSGVAEKMVQEVSAGGR